MTKSEVVNEISRRTGMKREDIAVMVESMMDVVKDSLSNGEEVYFRGFGSFIIKHRAQKPARNMALNTTVIIPAHNVPSFKPSKEFVAMMKNDTEE